MNDDLVARHAEALNGTPQSEWAAGRSYSEVAAEVTAEALFEQRAAIAARLREAASRSGRSTAWEHAARIVEEWDQ